MGRAQDEAELARILANVQAKERKRIIAALGSPPSLDNVPAGFWNEYENKLKKEIIPALEKTFVESARTMAEKTPKIAIDWKLVNTAASDWAKQYGFDLVSDLTQTTRTGLQDKVAAFFESEMTIPEFAESLQPLFGPVRASIIASTEVTRASVMGQAGLVAELNKEGIQLVAKFLTSEDSLVCPICSPLNGKIVDESEWPPQHPACRCDLAFVPE